MAGLTSRVIGVLTAISLGLLSAPASAHPLGLAGALARTVVGLAALPFEIAAAATSSLAAPAYTVPQNAAPYGYGPAGYYARGYYAAPSYRGDHYGYRATPRWYSPASGNYGRSYRPAAPRYNSWSGYRSGSYGGYYHHPH